MINAGAFVVKSNWDELRRALSIPPYRGKTVLPLSSGAPLSTSLSLPLAIDGDNGTTTNRARDPLRLFFALPTTPVAHLINAIEHLDSLSCIPLIPTSPSSHLVLIRNLTYFRSFSCLACHDTGYRSPLLSFISHLSFPLVNLSSCPSRPCVPGYRQAIMYSSLFAF